MAHEYEDEHEKPVKTTVYLEEEVLKAPEVAARGLARDTGRRWSGGGLIRLALSDFVRRRGKMV